MHTAIQGWIDGEPTYNGIVNLTKYKLFNDKLRFLEFSMNQFYWIGCGKVLIEGVDFRMSSEVSMASAGRGNLSLLAYIVGAISTIMLEKRCTVYDPVLYREWAGQLSYDQLRNILSKKFKIETKNEHIAAAVGIGLAAKGLL